MGTLLDLRGTIPPAELNAIKLNEVPFCITYVFPAKDFGAGNWTEIVESPAGFRGRVRAVFLYDITETFNSVTTEAILNIGTAADADLYGTTGNLGDLASDTSDAPALADGITLLIAESTSIQVQGIAPTGGVPTGIATVAVTIQYFK